MRDEKKSLLRVDRRLYDLLHRWADDDLRSLNGQIEFLLREAAIQAGRMKRAKKKRRQSSD